MNPDPNPVFVLLAVFCPFGIVGTIIGTIALLTYHQRVMRSRELAAELVLQMLNRKQSVEEIERVLLAWSQDSDRANAMARARKKLAALKPQPSF